MARKVEPRVLDFTNVQSPDEQYQELVKVLRRGRPPMPDPLEVKGPTTFSVDKDGKLRHHTKPVPAFRMQRARRILWECRQRPEWEYRQDSFFRHPSLMNISAVVLKQLVKESEGTDVRQ